MKKYIWTIILLLSLLGMNCQTTEILMPQGGVASDTFTEKQRYAHMLYILEVSDPLKPSCDQRVKKLVIKRDWLDGTLYFFIAPIYMTRTIEAYCN